MNISQIAGQIAALEERVAKLESPPRTGIVVEFGSSATTREGIADAIRQAFAVYDRHTANRLG